MGYFDDLWPNTQAPKMAVLQGGSVYSSGKLVTSVVGTAYKRLLLPTDLMQVSSQGATPEQILVNAWGACGTATGETFTVAQGYAGSQGNDSYGLAIPSAPQAGDSIRVGRTSLTSSRQILHKITKQKRQWFVQDVRPLDGIIVKHYGTYSFVDANGVTHQPPGKRDPVVQLPGVGAHIDNDTIKFDANGQMYADLFGQGAADGSGASVATVGGLKAGHGIELIPGFIPTESPTVVVEAGGSVPAGSYSYMYVWLYGTVRTPQSPSVSCTTIDGPPTTYHQPHLTIPGKDDINHATGVELYRKDASVGANGTIQTKFAYTSSPGVLIGDPSTGASLITTGAYTGMWQYTAATTTGNVQAGDEWEYNPLIRVKVGIPPIPYDPRDGSLTTLIINGAQDGSSVFKTSDGGALNPVTGAITYPQDNPLNHSGFRLVDTLPAQAAPYDYIDTKTDAMLGALYVKQATSINVKPARYLIPPFSSMAAVSGTAPPLYELSGFGFSSANPTISNDGAYIRTNHGTIISKTNDVEILLSASLTIPAAGTGAQTTSTVPGYDTVMYKKAGLLFGGTSGRELAVAYNPATLELDSQDRLNVIGGGGGGGGTGSAVAIFGRGPQAMTTSIAVSSDSTLNLFPLLATDHGGWVAAGSATDSLVIPVTGTYFAILNITTDIGTSSPVNSPGDLVYIRGELNGTDIGTTEYDLGGLSDPGFVFDAMFDATAGDVLQLRVLNRAGHTIASIEDGNYAVWQVTGAGTGLGDGQVINTGLATGTKIGTNASNKIGFYGATPTVQIVSTGGGGVSAGATYTATERAMLEDVYVALRTLGLLG